MDECEEDIAEDQRSMREDKDYFDMKKCREWEDEVERLRPTVEEEIRNEDQGTKEEQLARLYKE